MSSSEYTLADSASFSSHNKGARRIIFTLLQKLQGGGLLLREAGIGEIQFGDTQAPLQAEIEVYDPRVYRRILLGGSIAGGESYIDGYWSSPDLTRLLQLLASNMQLVDKMEARLSWLTAPWHRLVHLLRDNSRRQARRNIAAHYDLGNSFYQQFLDSEMLYSSALYSETEMTLEQAQQAKMRRLCQQLDLQPQDHLLEIGTGWGALAEFAAREYGCRVTTTTISQEQYVYAQQRIQQAGLEDRVTLLFEDYRELTGQYDKLVSVEMIEAVGKRFLPLFIKRCQQLLKPKGKMVLQAITITDQRYQQYSNNVDFIQRYVFPGGFLPSITALCDTLTRHSDLVMCDLFDIGRDYARTLQQWRERFEQNWPLLHKQGFDERFQRQWRFYLCYCEAGFLARSISTVQLSAERR
ncbi:MULTISPECIES: SAM-dependent methyltransferase [Yersinia]|jgi:cyclopropane-fatty-acyl-phospholipid synthase|uniref:Cyclopropane-fatty-acyl-phospholipid synthase n=1 Tax=Yersinia intermedia TaxID=631 RepID=A0A0T9MYH9_YERIN|nr:MULTISPECIES: cyclopropane-fatty-acyl-phospholipid synthase family protein [Yersinia]ARB86427.1 methyltransferase domain-containing protein [Yersinia sp. FDAARGOS_228]AVL36288.1 methyltransferase domain-containing protein [Yersinia intermedia]MCB5300339.1 cyclopropane-fatty-acyl-phospholipid synthase family protein [Yersinia intermedia]MCW8113697.1 cyclopropane-fatty-acyl-phospholipid synthase family protein [Yersinia intermedia]MDA5482730.1 cyclopropane-fatty-acyl-phospholipid synthase [Ye